MDRKQIDLAFGNVATILTLKELQKLHKETTENKNPDYYEYHNNNPLFSKTDKNTYPNLISINFTETFQNITGGISYLESSLKKKNEKNEKKKKNFKVS